MAFAPLALVTSAFSSLEARKPLLPRLIKVPLYVFPLYLPSCLSACLFIIYLHHLFFLPPKMNDSNYSFQRQVGLCDLAFLIPTPANCENCGKCTGSIAIYCYITNYHTPPSLKQHTLVTSRFCGSGV